MSPNGFRARGSHLRAGRARTVSGVAWYWLVSPLILIALVGCQTPRNVHVETEYMMRLGEETRRQSGRRIGEIVIPPSAQRPVVVPIAVGEGSRFRLMPAGDAIQPMASGTSTETSPEEGRSTIRAIGVDRDRFAEFLRTKYKIGIVDVRAINGRFTGDQNLLRVEFIPRGRANDAVLRDFMLICAAAIGMDGDETIDGVIGLATDAQLIPWMSLKTDLRAFRDYQAGALSLDEWRKQVEIRRF